VGEAGANFLGKKLTAFWASEYTAVLRGKHNPASLPDTSHSSEWAKRFFPSLWPKSNGDGKTKFVIAHLNSTAILTAGLLLSQA
jgi:hypothetical protein